MFFKFGLIMKWSKNGVRGIFQNWLTFLNDTTLLSIESIASSKAYVVHLPF